MSSETRTVTWRIEKAPQTVTLSPASVSLIAGSTATITASWFGNGTLTAQTSNIAVATVSVSGNVITVRGVGSGTVTITAVVAEGTNHLSGRTTASATITARTQVSLPTQSGTLTYNTGEQSPTWNNYSAAALTWTGDTSGTNAGTYTATFTPKDGYEWVGGGTDARDQTWSIQKAQQTVTLSPTTIMVGSGDTGTITATWLGNGTLSAQSSDTGVITTSVSDNIITITGVARGNVTITANVSAGTNYLAGSATATAEVKASTVVHLANTTPLSVARKDLTGASTTHYALAAGGTDASSTRSSTTDAYDANGTKQTPITSLQVARMGLSGCTSPEGNAMFFGGYINTSPSYRADAYDDSLTHYSITNMASSAWKAGCAVAGNYTICAGGFGDGNPAPVSLINVYSGMTRNTSYSGQLSQARYGMAAASSGTSAVFMGGAITSPSAGVVGTVDEVTETLTVSTPSVGLSSPRCNVMGLSLGGYAVAVGGENSIDNNALPMNTVDAFEGGTRIYSGSIQNQVYDNSGWASAGGFGGIFGGVTTNIAIFIDSNLTEQSFPEATGLNTARWSLCAASAENRTFLVMGGWAAFDNSVTDVAEVYAVS